MMGSNFGKRVGFRLPDGTFMEYLDVSTKDRPCLMLAILEDGKTLELEEDEMIEDGVIVERRDEKQ